MALRILLIDDERDSLESLTWLLRGSGYSVLTASEAADVLQLERAADGDLPTRPTPLAPSSAEQVARGLLHRVASLSACLQMVTDVTEDERRLWPGEIATANRRLDALYTGGLSRDFLGEPTRLYRQRQGGAA